MTEIFTLIGQITVGLVALLGVAVGLALLAGAAWSTYAAFVGAKDWVALKTVEKFTGMTDAERSRLNRAVLQASCHTNLSIEDCQKLIVLLQALPEAFKQIDTIDDEDGRRDAERDAQREAERKQWEIDYDH
jgi:hypothetical protein